MVAESEARWFSLAMSACGMMGDEISRLEPLCTVLRVASLVMGVMQPGGPGRFRACLQKRGKRSYHVLTLYTLGLD